MPTRIWVIAVCGLLAAACADKNVGRSQGEFCSATWECAVPLVCASDGTCQHTDYPGTGALGDECVTTDDCRIDYVCSSEGFCAEPGHRNVGEECYGTEQCLIGLICSGDGLCATAGSPGTGQPGDDCDEVTDCELGLFCSELDGTCHRLGGDGDACADHDQCRETYYCDDDNLCRPRGSDGDSCTESSQCHLGLTCWMQVCTPIPEYPGVTCADTASDTGPFRVYFEVPRGEITSPIEFYRLPFPNDVRLRNGRVDLSGHPDPGTLVPGEVVTKYIDAIEQEMDGFGLNTVSFFRFSKMLDYSTLSISGPDANILYLNIDPQSPGYGFRHSGQGYSSSSGAGKYICQNWLAVHPMGGYPLRHATTYAVILLDSIQSNDSDAATPDADFAALLEPIAPADADMQHAWLAYQPLRDYLADTSLPPEAQVDPARIIGASVFTTMDPDKHSPKFRHVIRNDPTAPTPDVTDLTLCEAATTSPCDDGLSGAEHLRGCMGVDPAVHEIHGRFTTPVFQQGTPPYETAGGEIAYTADGTPLLQDEQEVCFGLSVPADATMPASGWPIVIYLHGTGGSFRSHFDDGVAGNLADVDLGGGVTTQMAVIGIDQVVHGDRREGVDTHPNHLFFNFTNPAAAKNNVLQGAADLYQLVRVVENFAEQVNGVGQVTLDASRIYFFGHSQGVVTGPVAVPFEPAVKGVVYSGGGALMMYSLLYKTNPLDVAGAVQFMLADGQVGFTHPVLNLMQLYFEPVDTINYLAQIFLDPVGSAEPRHALISYGLGDTYSPNATGRAMIRAAGAHLVRPVLDPIDYVGELDAPVTGNRLGGTLTEGAVQLDTDGTYDGHFVLTRNPDGVTVYTHFLGTLDTDPQGVPTIPAW